MRFFKEVLVAVMLLFSLSLTPFSQAYIGNSLSIRASGTISYPNTDLKLYVDGTVIKDPSGNPIRLQGFNVEPRDIDEEGVQWLRNRGFNSLRVCFYWHRLETREGRYDYSYVNKLDELFGLCKEYNIYVNLAFMQWQWSPYFKYYSSGGGTGFPEWLISGGGYADSSWGLKQCIEDFFLSRGYGVTMRQKFFEVWNFLVNRYSDNPYVWAYEVFNEPTIAKGVYLSSEVCPAIMDLYREFTETIRQIDSETTIIYHSIGDDAVKVEYENIVWTTSWYDLAYEGYNPSWEYDDLVERLQNHKNRYNVGCETPLIISEMGFTLTDEASGDGEAWIGDSFDVMQEIGLNNGYECYGWWIYDKGTKYGFRTPRDWYGLDTWIVSVLQEYA